MDMAEFLREFGYVVYEAATAKEAIKALQAEFVDLVFTHINLPDGMNGLELRAQGRGIVCLTNGCLASDCGRTIGRRELPLQVD